MKNTGPRTRIPGTKVAFFASLITCLAAFVLVVFIMPTVLDVVYTC
jgi:hypothetical protein